MIRIGRYFDRKASDTSGLSFEEWTPPEGGESMIINATELRDVNFTMTPEVDSPPPVQVRRSGRGHCAAVVDMPAQPLPKEYTMSQPADNNIRSQCW